MARRSERVPGRARRNVIRLGTAACVAIAGIAPSSLDEPDKPPSYALESNEILYLERASIVFLAAYGLLNVLVRGLGYGQLPTGLTREGLTWPEEVTAETTRAIKAVQRQVDSLEGDFQKLAKRAVLRRGK